MGKYPYLELIISAVMSYQCHQGYPATISRPLHTSLLILAGWLALSLIVVFMYRKVAKGLIRWSTLGLHAPMIVLGVSSIAFPLARFSFVTYIGTVILFIFSVVSIFRPSTFDPESHV